MFLLEEIDGAKMALASPAFRNFLRFEVSCIMFCGVRVAPKKLLLFQIFYQFTILDELN